jgi:hypothetical protein
MEPEEFEFTDEDLQAWIDGHSADRDSSLTRFVIDLRRAVDAFSEDPSPKLASWIADSSRCRRGDARLHAHIAELRDIIQSLAHLR